MTSRVVRSIYDGLYEDTLRRKKKWIVLLQSPKFLESLLHVQSYTDIAQVLQFIYLSRQINQGNVSRKPIKRLPVLDTQHLLL